MSSDLLLTKLFLTKTKTNKNDKSKMDGYSIKKKTFHVGFHCGWDGVPS